MTEVRDCVSSFVSIKTVNVLKENLSAVLVAPKIGILNQKHDLFPTLTMGILCLNLTRAKANWCHEIKLTI